MRTQKDLLTPGKSGNIFASPQQKFLFPLEHSLNHSNCEACLSAEGTMHTLSSREPFPAAARLWYASHSAYIRPNTKRSYVQYMRTLELFLQEIPLRNISNGTIRSYQQWRAQTAGPTRTNNETACLQQILKAAGLWKRLEEEYRPLPVQQKRVRQNMSEEQTMRLWKTCLVKPKRRLAGHCLIVMSNTTMGFGELRFVRREDVVLDAHKPIVIVNGGSKNDYRIRSVTLNRIALESMRWILHRWETLGGSKPEQYILPHRAETRGGKVQFDVPMGHIYRAARGILDDAGLGHLDPYDMRSHAITGILSNPDCSDQMYEELAGHSKNTKEMRMRYSQQRLENKAAITDKLCQFADHHHPQRAGLLVFPGGKRA